MMPESVKFQDEFPSVLEVTDINGAKRTYLEYNGVFTPGRIYRCAAPEGYTVSLFLPFMEGPPFVLAVKPPTSQVAG